MMKKTNILLVSLVAMMSVGVARAESTTKEYVDSQDTALYNRIKTQDTRLGMIRDWVNPQDGNKQRATLQTEAQDAYRAINELKLAIDAKADSADIPDVTDMETATHAAATYQPKGTYLTSTDIADMETATHAAATYQPKGTYLTEHQSLEGLATTSDIADMETQTHAAATYQPKGSYLTSTDIADMETQTHAAATYQPKGTYLTEHQSLEGLATDEDITELQEVITTNAQNVATSLGGKQNKIDAEHPLSAELVDGLATVATSGEYADLANKPAIPTVDAALDATSHNAIENAAVATALADKADASDVYTKSQTYSKTEIDTALDGVSGDVGSIGTQISTALADYTATADLADVALSGEYSDLLNKPTIPTVDSALSASSTNPVQNKVVTGALGEKVPLGSVPPSGQYVLGFVDGVQMYIPIVDADGNSGNAIAAVNE